MPVLEKRKNEELKKRCDGDFKQNCRGRNECKFLFSDNE